MGPSVQQMLIVLAIILILFGAKKIPELAKGLGKGIKNFKEEMKEEEEEEITDASGKEEQIKKPESKEEKLG